MKNEKEGKTLFSVEAHKTLSRKKSIIKKTSSIKVGKKIAKSFEKNFFFCAKKFAKNFQL